MSTLLTKEVVEAETTVNGKCIRESCESPEFLKGLCEECFLYIMT